MSKMSSRHQRGDYEIGKGRPPKSTRWKPGQSGNPKGRPKGLKNAARMATDALNRKLTVTMNGKGRKMSVADVAYRRIADKAMEGDQKALAFLLMLANNLNPTEMVETDAISTEKDLAI